MSTQSDLSLKIIPVPPVTMGMPSDIEVLGRRVCNHFGGRDAWKRNRAQTHARLGAWANLLKQSGENWRELPSVALLCDRANTIYTTQQVAQELNLPINWILCGRLGADGLATLRRAALLAQTLGETVSDWPSHYTADEVVAEVVFDLQARVAERAQPVAEALVVETDAQVADMRRIALITRATGVQPTHEIAQIQAVDSDKPEPLPPPPEEINLNVEELGIADTCPPASIEVDRGEDSEPATTAQPKQKPTRKPKGVRKAIAQAKARGDWTTVERLGGELPADVRKTMEAERASAVITTLPEAVEEPVHAIVRVLGRVDLTKVVPRPTHKPGDRITDKDGNVLYVCMGNGCMEQIPADQAWMSSERDRVWRAYKIPLNRSVLPQDLDREHGHPVFCDSCAQRVLKGPSQPQSLSALMDKAAGHTDAELVLRGKALVQMALAADPRHVAVADLRELGLWRDGVTHAAQAYFQNPDLSKRHDRRGRLVQIPMDPKYALAQAKGELRPSI